MSKLKQDIIKHWQSFKNPIINDVLINIEQLEQTTPELTAEEEDKVAALIKWCEKVKAEEVNAEQFIVALNALPAAYMLYIIHKLQSINQDLIMKVITFAQKHRATHPEIQKFFQRNMVFEKSQLLGRIFSTQRMENVLEILNERS